MTDGSRVRGRGGRLVQGEEKHAGSRFPRGSATLSLAARFHEAGVYPRRANKPRFPLETFESRRRKREERPRAGRGNQACPKLWKEWRGAALDPLAVSLELLVDYVVSRKLLVFFSLGRDIKRKKEREKEEGPERTASIRRERDAESRRTTRAYIHTHVQRETKEMKG